VILKLTSKVEENLATKKDIEVLIGAIDGRIHRGIETDQLILLTAEVMKDLLEKEMVHSPTIETINEYLESIISKNFENAEIFTQIRKTLNEIRTLNGTV
jgi:hypothetical protein